MLLLRWLIVFALVLGVLGRGDPVKRKYSFETSNNKLQVKAEVSDKSAKDSAKDAKKDAKKGDIGLPEINFGTKTQDKLMISVETTGDGIKTKLKWFSKSEDTKEQFHFSQRIKDAVEFVCRPCGADCCPFDRDLDKDSILATYNFGSWDPAQYQGCREEDDQCKATFQSNDGLFSMVFTLNTAGLKEGSLALTENDIKIDINENFPLTGNNTSLAFRGRFESKSKSKRKSAKKPNEDPEEMDAVETEEADQAAVSATFSWLSEVDCGPVKRKVKTSGVKDGGTAEDEEGGEAKEMAWTVLKHRGDQACVWDPVMTFNDNRFCWECYGLFILLGIVFLVCCCPIYWCCCRKKGNSVRTRVKKRREKSYSIQMD